MESSLFRIRVAYLSPKFISPFTVTKLRNKSLKTRCACLYFIGCHGNENAALYHRLLSAVSVHILLNGRWIDAAKFLTGASSVGSLAIPIILRHADLINTGAMFIEFTSFFIFVMTVLCFHRASLDDDW